jgi:cholesterol transport system auxiliary component
MSRFALLSTVLLAAGCSGGLHSDGPPSQIYILRTAASPPPAADARDAALTRGLDASSNPANGAASAPSLQLSRVSAAPGLATDLITLVHSDRRLDYYAGSRWAAELPDVLETLAIGALRASGHWSAVHESPSPFISDYLLDINIRRFEADYSEGGVAPRVYVVLDCTLARRIGRELVMTFVAEGDADAGENRLSVVVAAFEKAANAALATMAERSAAAARSASVAAPP